MVFPKLQKYTLLKVTIRKMNGKIVLKFNLASLNNISFVIFEEFTSLDYHISSITYFAWYTILMHKKNLAYCIAGFLRYFFTK